MFYPLIEVLVYFLVLRAEVGTVFALSWLITWFGHVLSDFRHVVRLYDFFLACHPLMPIYFAAVASFTDSALRVCISREFFFSLLCVMN